MGDDAVGAVTAVVVVGRTRVGRIDDEGIIAAAAVQIVAAGAAVDLTAIIVVVDGIVTTAAIDVVDIRQLGVAQIQCLAGVITRQHGIAFTDDLFDRIAAAQVTVDGDVLAVLGDDAVGAVTAVVVIGRTRVGRIDDEGIITAAAVHIIAAGTADQRIIAVACPNGVVSVEPPDAFALLGTGQPFAAAGTKNFLD